LAKAPEMIIVKSRVGTSSWLTYHIGQSTSTPEDQFLRLEGSNATETHTGIWNSTAPTTTVFSSGNSLPSGNVIAYCFHSVDGYSKVGSYTGNGSTDGTFVYTGFRPAYVMMKRSSASEDWYARDTARDPINAGGNALTINSSASENNNCASSGNTCLDYVSNGFKIRGGDTANNASGSTYIYLAFAEVPFKFSNAR